MHSTKTTSVTNKISPHHRRKVLKMQFVWKGGQKKSLLRIGRGWQHNWGSQSCMWTNTNFWAMSSEPMRRKWSWLASMLIPCLANPKCQTWHTSSAKQWIHKDFILLSSHRRWPVTELTMNIQKNSRGTCKPMVQQRTFGWSAEHQ